MEAKVFSVSGMHCSHCEAAVITELERVAGVRDVEVDLETKLVRVRGDELDTTALVVALDEAGYDGEEVAA